MNSPFNWQATKREVPKEFRRPNSTKGTMPPIVLPNSSKFVRPPMQGKKK